MAIKGKSKTLKKIVKRNGSIVKFDSKKIADVITKAGAVTGEFDELKAKKITVKVLYLAQQLLTEHIPTVEDIANCVEEVLMDTYKETAKAFILYRDQQQRQTEFSVSEQVKLVNQYLKKKDWKVNENSNMAYSLQGLQNYISSEVSSTYWLSAIYPKNMRDAHKNGDLHIHDLSNLAPYCNGWSLEDLLKEGFRGVESKTESKAANHFRTALGQIVNFFYTLQGESAGAQAFSSFDTLLAPFVYYDKLDYTQVKQAIQEFVFNVNVPTRVGFQAPFTNITLDLTVSSNYKDQAVIVGGKQKKKVYGDFQKEMDMINKAFFEVMLAGDAKGRIFTFPIPTVNITKDFNWDNPDLELLWQITGKYGVPYFSNFINSSMSPEQVTSMCCRLRLDHKQLELRGGGLFGSNPLTGSVGVVTINMARIGFLSKDKKDFNERLKHLMVLAKDSLIIKRNILEKFTEEGLYPYSKFYLRNTYQRFNKYWANHFSTIGLIAMNEACLNLLGCDIGAPEGKQFAEETLEYMRNILVEFQQETGDNFNLEATPAEGTCYSLALKDKELDKKIICANEESYRQGAEPYYSNSTQLPVKYTDDIFQALDLQDKLQSSYTGGTVLHLFLGEKIDDFLVVKTLVKKICENYHLPYFSITPTFSICPICGYLPGEQEYCPKCDERILRETKEEINE